VDGSFSSGPEPLGTMTEVDWFFWTGLIVNL
jgi:hypothetical protein